MYLSKRALSCYWLLQLVSLALKAAVLLAVAAMLVQAEAAAPLVFPHDQPQAQQPHRDHQHPRKQHHDQRPPHQQRHVQPHHKPHHKPLHQPKQPPQQRQHERSIHRHVTSLAAV